MNECPPLGRMAVTKGVLYLRGIGEGFGAGNPVRKWIHHLRKRWADDQNQRAERKAHAAARPGRASSYVPPRKFDSTNYQQPVEKF